MEMRMQPGERTAPSNSSMSAFEEWRIKSVNAITTPRGVAVQRFSVGIGPEEKNEKPMDFPVNPPSVDWC